jgi:hypothetical protein
MAEYYEESPLINKYQDDYHWLMMAGLDKSIIRKLINSGGLSQLLA